MPRLRPLALFLLLLPALALAPRPAAAQRNWETYKSESMTLRSRESFQFRVDFDQIQVRSWKLVVDGGQNRCDLNVLRLKDESLLYFRTDESHHEVLVPWGRGEEIIVVVTNRDVEAAFTISLEGPPRDQVHAAYGYHVNRALEAFAAGRRLEAEAACRSALLDDPHDGVAKVLLAGCILAIGFWAFYRPSAILPAVFGAVVAVQVAVIIGLVRSKLLTSRSAVSQRVSDAV